MRCRSIRIVVRADAIFVRIPAYFATPVYDVDDTQDLDLQAVTADLTSKMEHWNARGSGFILDRITKFVISITQYRPLHGSSYIETPKWLSNKKCSVKREEHQGLEMLRLVHPRSPSPSPTPP